MRASEAASRQVGQIAADAQEFYAANKRPWCQPSTILMTGAAISAGSWRVFGHGWWSLLALGATTAVLVWWFLFLVELPLLAKAKPELFQPEDLMQSDK